MSFESENPEKECMSGFRTGLDLIRPDMLPGSRPGLLSHYAAVDRHCRNSVEVIAGLAGTELVAVFGPQHGFFGETQDNMIEWDGYRHPVHGIPVYSLYGETREPLPRMLEGMDCLVVDLQDVGSRYYTYIYTMALCMRSCATAGIPVLVLDRPNPLGATVIEGRPLDTAFASFVGMYPIPVRHGLTIGELALLFARMDGLPDPRIVPMRNWDGEGHPMSMPWVYPSPNMPTRETALVYPGMCLLEATNLSEGRGTTKPFEVFGAPWLDGRALAEGLNGTVWTEGVVLRPHEFIPTFNKHAGETCRGVEMIVTDPGLFRPLRTGVGILLHSFRYSRTAWNPPPYEYERVLPPIDILAGGTELREAVDSGDTEGLLALTSGDPVLHAKATAGTLLYERKFSV